jgi:Cu2+-exporting ATPase
VFVQEHDLWARLGRVRKIIFDKTGTLTLEVPALANPEALATLGEPDRRALVALVRDNPHPVSRALYEALLVAGNAPAPLEGTLREETGFGVSLHAADGTWTLGRPGWLGAAGGGPRPADVAGGPADAEFGRDGRVLARWRFVEAVRADARVEVDALRAGGREVYLLSGDRQAKVGAMADQLGLPRERAVGEAPPEAKAGWVRELDRQDTLMLGDGANDSLAFEHAFCRGTPVVHRGVLERKADFYYLGGGIGGIRRLFEINRVLVRTQTWILAFAVAYNAAAVGFAVAGRINPLIAAILMPASALVTLGIVGWGMRPATRQ